ncbi:hypothetical protein OIV83_003523 [Microbotryomycetes sp. JL201]|nr:hypothetical protein OIV83_003523 [Microbotryomycetes sp. JL201]
MSRPPNGNSNGQQPSRPLIQRPKTQAPPTQATGQLHSAIYGALGSMGYSAAHQHASNSMNHPQAAAPAMSMPQWASTGFGSASLASAMAPVPYHAPLYATATVQGYNNQSWGAYNPAIGAPYGLNGQQIAAHATLPQRQQPRTTEQGYTLSSTYVDDQNDVAAIRHQQGAPKMPNNASRPAKRARTDRATSMHTRQPNQHVHSDIPGSATIKHDTVTSSRSGQSVPSNKNTQAQVKCSLDGCEFQGSSKQAREHEEDRHLIFAPGREPKPWSGKLATGVTIEGTSMSLDTPEAVAQWIEERKKRWPTNRLIAEKEAQRQERIAAGLEAPSGRGGPRGARGARGRGANLTRGARASAENRGRIGATAVSRQSAVDETQLAAKAEKNDSDSDSDSSSDSSEDSSDDEDDEDDENDGDELPEESSSKPSETVDGVALADDPLAEKAAVDWTAVDGAIASDMQLDRKRVVCKFWRSKGGCGLGDRCHFLHSLPDKSTQPSKPPVVPTRKRPAPPAPPHNPFARSFDPFEQLQERDWQQVIENVLQVIDFLSENEWLKGVERRVGEMDEESGIEVLDEKKEDDGAAIDRKADHVVEKAFAIEEDHDSASDNELVITDVAVS